MAFIIDRLLIKALTAPVVGSAVIGMKLIEVIRDQADAEIHPNEAQVKEKLIELQKMIESGQLSEQEYEAKEAVLMQRWQEIQESKGVPKWEE